MAKNLKIKIKNTQLAAALKKNEKPIPEKPTKKKVVKSQDTDIEKTLTKKTLTSTKPTPPSSLKAPSKNQKTPTLETPSKSKPTKKNLESAQQSNTTEPKSNTTEPKSNTTEPKSNTTEPKSNTTEPKSNTPEPKSNTTEPKSKTIEPKSDSFNQIKKREKEISPPKEEQKQGFKANFGRVNKDPKKKHTSRFDSRDRKGLRVGEERTWKRRRSRFKAIKDPIEIIRPKNLSVRTPISLKDLAQAMKIKASELIAKLFMQGVMITINDYLDDETTIQLLGHEFDCEITIDTSEEERLSITQKTILEEIQETNAEKLQPRAPVIAFMGHVDHGKTSLIDVIRKSNVAGGEAGAITQHIGAFKCHHDQGDITILDTPGHEAFTLMRQRGTALTDVIVLVIAGDEGIMPQTEEAIKLAIDATIPIVVAINKCDKSGFDAENVHRQLADHNLLPEAWGGEILTVKCSASSGEGIPQLLETLVLQTDMQELKANPDSRARGTVLESQLHKGFGPVATILVQNGTLKLGDAIVFKDIYARIKTMHDEHGKPIQLATPSTPVKITGMSGLPEAGCEFIVVENEKMARKLTEERTSGEKRASLQKGRGELETIITRQKELSEKKIVNLILRADVQGSVEAIRNSLLAIKTNKVELNFISEGVGEISESDIELAKASNSVIIGFHTHIESHAENLIKTSKVVIKKRDIIYQIIDDIKEIMLASLDKIRQEHESGIAEIKQVFKASQIGFIAGCMVIDGIIKRQQYAKLYRDNQIIWEGHLNSLKRVKEDVKEVSKGIECGILLERFNSFQEGDFIKTYEITYIQQEL